MGVIPVTATDTPLVRRRDKAGAAEEAAEKAQASVTDIDNQLQTLDGLAEQQKQALRRAEDEAARLKRSIKAADKRREQLLRDRKKAVTRAEKAKTKAETAETKYDKQVLAEMVRREKARDRRAAKTAAAERENLATTTSRRTAARKTARP
jgi:chromosome segregation ATPase